MKQILSILLAFQLMIVPVIGAAAANEQNDPAQNAEVDIGSNAEYDARSQSGEGYQAYAKQILGASTAIVGANIISSCTWGAKVPSILTYMSGAIAYLISEVTGGKKQNDDHKARLKRVEEIKKKVAEIQGGGDVQRVLLEQRLKEEEKILEFVNNRNKWVMAIMAIYTIAAALSVTEEMSGIAAGTAIGMSTCTGLAAKYASPCGKAYAACYAKHMAACTTAHPLGQVAAKAAFMSPTSLATGKGACAGPYAPACMANLQAYAAIAYANCQPLQAGTITASALGKSFTVNLYAAAFGLGFSYGSEGNLQKLLQLGVALTNLFTNGLAVKITALYSYPIPRSVTFAAHAGLMATISYGLGEVAKQTEKNIKKLRKVVSQFREQTDDHNGLHKGAPEPVKGDGPDELKIVSPGAVELAHKTKSLKGEEIVVNKIKTCFSQDGDEMDVSEKACDKAVTINPISINLKHNKSEHLADGVLLVNELNNALKDGDLDLASSTSTKLAAMAMSLRKELQETQKKYNKTLPKEKQVEFASAVEQQIKELQMNNDAKEIFESFEKEQGIKLASIALSELSTSTADKATDLSQDIREVSGETTTMPLTTEAVTERSPLQFDEGMAFLDEEALERLQENDPLLFGGDKTSNNPFGLNGDAFRAASVNGYLPLHQKNSYNTDAEGIAKKQVDLFKVISNRYFLSYPKVMKRKGLDEEKTE